MERSHVAVSKKQPASQRIPSSSLVKTDPATPTPSRSRLRRRRSRGLRGFGRGSRRNTSCVPADEDSQRGFEKPRRKPAALQVPGVLRFNLLVRLPLFFLLMNLY